MPDALHPDGPGTAIPRLVMYVLHLRSVHAHTLRPCSLWPHLLSSTLWGCSAGMEEWAKCMDPVLKSVLGPSGKAAAAA